MCLIRCGKSTTIREWFGLEWMPAGDGNSTTRPIYIQLVNTKTIAPKHEEEGEGELRDFFFLIFFVLLRSDNLIFDPSSVQFNSSTNAQT
jgi:hypothetical protein